MRVRGNSRASSKVSRVDRVGPMAVADEDKTEVRAKDSKAGNEVDNKEANREGSKVVNRPGSKDKVRQRPSQTTPIPTPTFQP